MTMKRFFRIFAAVALVCSTFVACEEKFVDYTPAAQESTAQVYFSKDTKTTIDILEATSVEIPVMRAVTAGALDVAIAVKIDEANAPLFNIPTKVSFADGENATKLVITFDPAKLTYGKKYAISLQLGADVITDYGRDLLTLTLDYPEPYVSLGKGKFIDTFLFEEEYDVEIQQNQIDPTMFRLVKPYHEGIEAEEIPTKGNAAEFVTFRILKKGEILEDVEITREDLIVFDSYNSGLHHPSYSADVNVEHPSLFKVWESEEAGLYNKVTEWQKPDKNGNVLPGIVQFAPFYYMDGIGGWNYSTTDGMIKITFPNYEPKDYSLSLIANGAKVVDGKAYPVVDAIFGADVDQLVMTVIPGHYQNDTSVWSQVPGLIEQGVFEAVTVEAVDQTKEESRDEEVNRMSIVGGEALDADIYTAFVIPVNADGEAQNAAIAAVSFYMNEVDPTVPEFEFYTFAMLPSDDAGLAEELGVEDDHNSAMFLYMSAANYVREWKHIFVETKALEDALKADKTATLKSIVLAAGDDVDLEYMNNYGMDYWAEEDLKAETSYSAIDYVVDIYGNVYCERTDITTAAAPKKEEAEATAKFQRMDVTFSNDVKVKSNLLE